MKYAACTLLLLVLSTPLAAQELPPGYNGPPPPSLPETGSRDGARGGPRGAPRAQPGGMAENERGGDAAGVYQNENFAFAFDTFYDRRNSVNFQFNPVGGRMDGQNANEGQDNGDWNPCWVF